VNNFLSESFIFDAAARRSAQVSVQELNGIPENQNTLKDIFLREQIDDTVIVTHQPKEVVSAVLCKICRLPLHASVTQEPHTIRSPSVHSGSGTPQQNIISISKLSRI
jgi:hypothetical protein